jgi:hypothetical protein
VTLPIAHILGDSFKQPRPTPDVTKISFWQRVFMQIWDMDFVWEAPSRPKKITVSRVANEKYI